MKRLKKALILLGLIFLVGIFSSFGDSQDINKKAIATTIAADARDGELYFYAELANIQQGGGSSGGGGGGAKKYSLVTARGQTIPDARLNLNRQLDMPLYLSGVRTLVLTENFAKDHLVEYLYRLRADETYRKKILTVVTRDSLEELFKALNDQDQSLGYSIEHTIETLETTGDGFTRTTSRLLEKLSKPYTGMLIPTIGLQGKEVIMTGYSIVNDTKVVGFLPIEECKGLNMLKVDNAESFYIIPYKNDHYTVQTLLTKRSVKASFENGKPAFNVSLNFDASLEYADKKTPYAIKDADSQALTSFLEQMIKLDVTQAIQKAQSTFNTDYFQFDDAFRARFPVLADHMDWNNEFSKALITVDTKVKLNSTYMMDYAADVSR